MTRLRKMMLEELQRRNYSEITTRKYLQYVTAFARHFGKSPDQLGPNELRSYQAYLLQERKVTPGTAVNCVAACVWVRLLRSPTTSSLQNYFVVSIVTIGWSMPSLPSASPCRCCAIWAATPIAWPFPIIACWPSTKSA